jgi:hypothetical protein
MKTSSSKAKGRRAMKEAQEIICRELKLHEDDVRVTNSGMTGEDLQLSPKARNVFPFAVEGKCTEKLNIYKAIEQAESHVKQSGIHPMVIFRKNHTELQVTLSFELFMEIYSENCRLQNLISQA